MTGTHYFKKWTTASGVLKKIYCLNKNLMLQIDPFNSSCSQKTTIPQNIKVKVLRKSISLEKVAVLKVILASANVYNCSQKYLLYFMNDCNYCCGIVKSPESNCSKSHPCKWKCLRSLF